MEDDRRNFQPVKLDITGIETGSERVSLLLTFMTFMTFPDLSLTVASFYGKLPRIADRESKN